MKVLAGLKHTHAEQRRTCQVERFVRFELAQTIHFGVESRRIEVSEIDERNLASQRGLNDLHRLAGGQLEVSTQDLVTARNFADRALEDRDVQRSQQLPSHTDVAGRIARRQLIEQPEALLLQRERRADGTAMTQGDR